MKKPVTVFRLPNPNVVSRASALPTSHLFVRGDDGLGEESTLLTVLVHRFVHNS